MCKFSAILLREATRPVRVLAQIANEAGVASAIVEQRPRREKQYAVAVTVTEGRRLPLDLAQRQSIIRIQALDVTPCLFRKAWFGATEAPVLREHLANGCTTSAVASRNPSFHDDDLLARPGLDNCGFKCG
jgi:hypothetical protein